MVVRKAMYEHKIPCKTPLHVYAGGLLREDMHQATSPQGQASSFLLFSSFLFTAVLYLFEALNCNNTTALSGQLSK